MRPGFFLYRRSDKGVFLVVFLLTFWAKIYLAHPASRNLIIPSKSPMDFQSS